MGKILKMGSAFIGIIVGAGFASGQEILQYFTSFGLLGVAGAIVSTALFAYLGMTLTRIGSRMRTTSHKEAIYKISGRYLGIIVDTVIIITLFSVGVVMIAGAGSNLNQQFGLPSYMGSLLMVVLVFLTVLLNVDKVVGVIGSITPFLIAAVVLVSIYCLMTIDTTFSILDPIARDVKTTLPNWFISSINYVSFNIATGASMTLVMGGAEKDERIAKWGGLVGGLGLGILILLSHLAIFSKIESVADAELPMLAIINDISPILAILMAFVLYGMIFNTAVGMFYAFGARFVPIGTKGFKMFVLFTLVIGFALSFVGFTNLVAHLYPFIGYMGLFLIVALIIAPFRMAKKVAR
ncbi:hypothetical protein MHZ95_15830 [Sporosarcina sp. ACRSM]|uniref:YkvI family membrane protein n=1 Tax=Sporosarcina sp. ACRSM TaxID=2918216 RepID=UPI001EF573D1|nr:hypothetical protein [Sporosarcina sp. ACRSM]MCG7336737.1 hypothetical protein [Sporosarcina sp. ACRSM]